MYRFRSLGNRTMPRTKSPPTYRLHKPRQCAVVTIHGKNHYLGPYGSPESHEEYARLIAQWQANGKQLLEKPAEPSSGTVSVNELILGYLKFALAYYVKHGHPTGEFENIRSALRHLKRLYGTTLAATFGPKDLELVRQSMIDAGLARRTINGRVSRIRRAFRWASREGLIPSNVYHGLTALEGLKRGRSAARETTPVTTVPDEHVRAVLPKVNG